MDVAAQDRAVRVIFGDPVEPVVSEPRGARTRCNLVQPHRRVVGERRRVRPGLEQILGRVGEAFRSERGDVAFGVVAQGLGAIGGELVEAIWRASLVLVEVPGPRVSVAGARRAGDLDRRVVGEGGGRANILCLLNCRVPRNYRDQQCLSGNAPRPEETL